MFIFEQRAATILYKLIKARSVDGPYLLPANVCPIVPLVFKKACRPFEFVDISLKTLCLDHRYVLRRLSESRKRIGGLVYVRSYGAFSDASGLFSRLKEHSPGALVIDDRCLCEPSFAELHDPNVDAEIYSTGYAKYVDIGFGGYAEIRDDLAYERTPISFCREDLLSAMKGVSDAIEKKEAFLYVDSNWLDTNMPTEPWDAYKKLIEGKIRETSINKKKINKIYASILPREIQLSERFNSWRFNIQVAHKKAVLKKIRDSGFFASGHYPSLTGVFDSGEAPNCELVHRHIINLFNDKYITFGQAERLAVTIAECNYLEPGPISL